MMNAAGPLAGCRVVEMARFVTGPFAAQLLADLGAEVIKIEDPDGGDQFRGWGRAGEGYAPQFLAFNRSKRSVTLDLKKPEAAEAARRLIADADVLIENFRPGVADRLGLGYERLSAQNPRLIYCSITGMGKDGPYAQHPCYDGVGQGMSGLMSLLVDMSDPIPVGPTFSDTLTGLFAGYGILAALQGRERTGKGQLMETSLLQATMGFMHEPFASYFRSGRAPESFDRPRISLVFTFVCRDGLPIVIHLSSPDKFWRNFMTAAGRPDLLDDPRFADHKLRQQNWEQAREELKPLFAARDRRDWLDTLIAADVPCAPLYAVNEVPEDPQVRHLGMVLSAMHPERGEVRSVGFPVTLNGTPLGPVKAPPTLGEHTFEVLAAAGYSQEEIACITGSRTDR